MYREILVQVAEKETKVAVLEEGQLVEIYVERALNQRLVGNIYKGVVQNVLPGMQAAFVDIGLEKNAFLYVEDALANVLLQDEVHVPVKEGVRPNIRDIVKEGQEIVVQIAKEPVGTKGARVTTQITLPGRYLVLMPTVDYTGISRRIEDDEVRERLKVIAEEIKPPSMGVIVRTVAEGSFREDLEQDIKSLMRIWQRIKNKAQTVSAPALLHKDLELVQRILRDVFTADVQRLSVNSRPVFEKIIDFLDATDTHLKGKVFLSDTNNLFKKYAIDHEMYQALKRKVWLKSGGYLVIDQTEALTAIDVNTGKFVGSTDLADTVLKTNLEAAQEIARQLRLRNIGGIIIIDFIDMNDAQHKEQVLKVLEEELKKDKVKAHILGITPLGLVEMTRKKVRQSLSSTLEKCCPYCEGKGKVLSEETILLSLKNEVKEVAARTTADTLLVEAHPRVTALLTDPGAGELRNLEQRLGKQIIVKSKEHFHLEHYEVKTAGNVKDFANFLVPVEEGQVLKAIINEVNPKMPQNSIININSYPIDVENGTKFLGKTVYVEILKVYRTYAKGKVLKEA